MDEMQNEQHRPKRRKRRRLRWGRLLFLLCLLGALCTAVFWSSVWVYDTFINPPQANVLQQMIKFVMMQSLMNALIFCF